MTTTARVTATTAASTAYTFSVAAGVTAVFSAHNLTADEKISFEVKDSAGTSYYPIKYRVNGWIYQAEINKDVNMIALDGPIDARINKPITKNSVEVNEHT